MTGKFAKSKAGHDKDKIYIIIKEEAEYVYLVDGIYRTLEKPKRKNKRHIQIIKKDQNEKITQKLLNKEALLDEEIKRAVKMYERSVAP